jgi:hypothetical protein
MWLIFLVQPKVMIVSHDRIDTGREIDRWAVTENTWGYRAMKFMDRMQTNMSMICRFVPFSDLFRVYLTSFLNVWITFLTGINRVCGFVHNLIGISSGNKIMIDQFRWRIEDPGSKVEKRLVIILVFFL